MVTSSLPQWTTEITDEIVPGEDMLGVEGAAQSYQQELIPGIITQTNRARYYSFYAWVLHRFIVSDQGNRLMRNFRGQFFKRHEVALILAAYRHHLDGEPIRNLVGAGTNNTKVRSWWDATDPVSLDVKYFNNPLGGFGQYYVTAMQVMGIVGTSENSSWVYPLTHRGEALALAYAKSIAKTNYLRQLEEDGQLDFLSHKDALNYGKAGCICAEALSKGEDLPLLREAFFRFDQSGEGNPHVRRRLALGVVLDLVGGARGKYQRTMLRPALYLGEYAPKQLYQPTSELDDWAFRWKMVEVRHLYTFGLQALWGSFILRLSGSTEGLSLHEFLAWAKKTIGEKVFDAALENYLSARCRSVGLSPNWQNSHNDFSATCLQSTKMDEFSKYIEANNNSTNPEILLKTGVQILVQHYLRFLHIYQTPFEEWREMAGRERLSINSFYQFMGEALASRTSLGQWLELLYKDFILGQHEFIALEKLRYQRYDTFKFYYRDGRFYWPFNQSNYWREPIRLAANRLGNALSILEDLGLIEESDEQQLSLTKDGKEYLARVVELKRNGN